MRKKSNSGITITLSKEDIEIIEFLAKYYKKSKTKIILMCLRSSKTLMKLWNEIDCNKLSIEDKIYYVKLVNKYYFINDNSNLDTKITEKILKYNLSDYEKDKINQIIDIIKENANIIKDLKLL